MALLTRAFWASALLYPWPTSPPLPWPSLLSSGLLLPEKKEASDRNSETSACLPCTQSLVSCPRSGRSYLRVRPLSRGAAISPLATHGHCFPVLRSLHLQLFILTSSPPSEDRGVITPTFKPTFSAFPAYPGQSSGSQIYPSS